MKLAGRLKHHITWWEQLTSDSVILEFVKGVKIEFQNGVEPIQTYCRISKFHAQEHALVELEIQKLLEKGVITPSIHEDGDLYPPYSCAARKTDLTAQY